jgi:uncharacterized protein (UPF0276 family)
MSFDGSALPWLGVGLGYRKELHEHYFRHRDKVDWLELIGDHYLRSISDAERSEEAVELSRSFPVIPHFLEHSVGSHEPIDAAYCRDGAELVRLTSAPFFGDHLCITRAAGLELGQLTPLPFTRATARRCAARAREIQDIVGAPLVLENIFRSFTFPGELSELEFINLVLEESGCGMLLDLANLFINSQNHGYDPHAFIDGLPAERIVQVHLAGSEKRGDLWMDTHSQTVNKHPEVWSLLEHLVARAPVKAVLLERDQNFPDDFGEILDDLDRARAILQKGRAAPPS